MKHFSALLSVLTLSIMFVTAQAIYYGNGAHGAQHFVTSADGQTMAVNTHGSDVDTDMQEMAFVQEDQPTLPVGEDQSGETMYALGLVEEDAQMEEPTETRGWFGGISRRQDRRTGRQERRMGRRAGRYDRRAARYAGRQGVSPMYIDELEDVEQPQ